MKHSKLSSAIHKLSSIVRKESKKAWDRLPYTKFRTFQETFWKWVLKSGKEGQIRKICKYKIYLRKSHSSMWWTLPLGSLQTIKSNKNLASKCQQFWYYHSRQLAKLSQMLIFTRLAEFARMAWSTNQNYCKSRHFGILYYLIQCIISNSVHVQSVWFLLK